jgi:hypothetical protein
MYLVWERREMYAIVFCPQNSKEGDHFENLGICGRVDLY